VSFLSRIFRSEGAGGSPQRYSDWDDFWFGPTTGLTTSSGMRVNPKSAMQLAAVYACVRKIARPLASIPLKTYRHLIPRGKEEAPEFPLYRVLAQQPNQWQTSYEFREMMQSHLLLRGNAYAEIVPGPLGAVQELRPIHPDRVRVSRLPNMRLRYDVTQPDGSNLPLNQDEVFHLRGYSEDGITGLSVIQVFAREVIGLHLAGQESAARSYRNGAQLGGVVSGPKKLDSEAYKNMRESWQGVYGDPTNAGKVAFLEQDFKFYPITVSPKDAEFLASRQYGAVEITRIFDVPQHKIGILDKASFNNIEQQSLEFVQDTLLPWCVMWEQVIWRDLIVPSQQSQFFAEFVLNGLLRADFETRMSGYSIAIQNEIMSPNECRSLENMNPYQGGDDYRNRITNPGADNPAGAVKKGPKAEIGALTGDEELRAMIREEIVARETARLTATLNGRNGHHLNGHATEAPAEVQG
jgi:HK97 family phage portal protein